MQYGVRVSPHDLDRGRDSIWRRTLDEHHSRLGKCVIFGVALLLLLLIAI